MGVDQRRFSDLSALARGLVAGVFGVGDVLAKKGPWPPYLHRGGQGPAFSVINRPCAADRDGKALSLADGNPTGYRRRGR